MMDSVFKNNFWTYRIKDLNEGKITLKIYKKNWMSNYQESDIKITDKVQLVMDLKNYATKKREHVYRCWYI